MISGDRYTEGLDTEHDNASSVCVVRPVIISDVQTSSLNIEMQSVRPPLQLVTRHDFAYVTQRRRQQLHPSVVAVRNKHELEIVN